MFELKKILKPAIAAAFLAIAPIAASAVTLLPSPGSVLLVADEVYNAVLDPITPIPGGSITYDLELGQVPLHVIGDVDVDLTPGASLTNFCAFWSTGAGGCTGALSDTTGNIDLSEYFSFGSYVPGEIVSLTIEWFGVTTSTPGGHLVADFQFDAITTVPVPAAGFLLLGALGGLGMMRRRRKAA